MTYNLFSDILHGILYHAKNLTWEEMWKWLRDNCEERTPGNFYHNGMYVWIE